MSEWISVKDRLPISENLSTRYIVYGTCDCGKCHKEKSVFEVRWRRKAKEFEYGEYDCSVDATHWQPLPEPPKEEGFDP